MTKMIIKNTGIKPLKVEVDGKVKTLPPEGELEIPRRFSFKANGSFEILPSKKEDKGGS